jgi:hypothetical protein
LSYESLKESVTEYLRISERILPITFKGITTELSSLSERGKDLKTENYQMK